MLKALKLGIVALTALSMAACVSRGEIQEIKDNQKKILTKLDSVGKGAPAARPERPRGPDPQKTYAFPIGKSSIKGNKDAWVTIVEVSDFQCPFCNRVNPTLKQVQEEYGDDVRFVFKHNALPFHKRAEPAAMAAECAGEQGKFWEVHDEMFANQKKLEDSDLEGYAKKAGVDFGKWQSCYKGNKYQAKIKGDQRQANALGARGTPAFFINGRYLSGAQPFPRFKDLIDAELKKAKASGIAKGDYYAKAIEAKGLKKL